MPSFELTPVEEYNNILFKRDDKFEPWSDLPLNGGKVRQAISLIENNLDNIKLRNNTIISATSVHSPQGVILAKVAKEYGLNCVLAIGGVKNISNNPLMLKAQELGAKIEIVSSFGYNSVLFDKVKKYNGFLVAFGMNAKEHKNSIITPIAKQVENIPEIDNLVIPVGSAVTICGILEGIQIFNKNIKTVYGIQIAGYNRMDVIYNTLPFFRYYGINLRFIPYKKFQYSKWVNIKFNNTEYLDQIYEAKAFDWLLNSGIDLTKEKTLFWIIGNTYNLRRMLYGTNNS